MSPPPPRLREAADALGAIAEALSADLADLVPLGGPSTWLGPAADAHRDEVVVQSRRIEEVVFQLRRLANHLVNAASLAEAHEREVVEVRMHRYLLGVDR